MKKIIATLILFLLPAITSAATLSLSPSSQNVNVGDMFSVIVNLDTQGASIDGVDLRYLNYNPAILQLQDGNTSASGVQITPGNLMPMTLVNSTNTNLGRITFSQATSGGNNKYKGSGVLATLTFKALAAGTVNVSFNYTSGNTTDTNVAAGGADVLTSVVNGSYIINNLVLTGGSGTTEGSSSSGGLSSGGSGGGGGSGNSSGTSGSNAGGFSSGSPSCASGLQTASLTRNLYKGLKGDDVKTLQTFLVNQKYLTADSVTGFFGPLTEKAVQAFQKSQNIISSGTPLSTGYGNVGPMTRTKINPMLSSTSCTSVTPTATTQSLQEQIKILQAQVNALLLKLQKAQ
jgi:hypothetical protein